MIDQDGGHINAASVMMVGASASRSENGIRGGLRQWSWKR